MKLDRKMKSPSRDMKKTINRSFDGCGCMSKKNDFNDYKMNDIYKIMKK